MDMLQSVLLFGGIGIFLIVIGSYFENDDTIFWFPIIAIGSGLLMYAFLPAAEMGIFELLNMFGVPLVLIKTLYWFVAIVIMPFFFKFASPKKSRR